MADAPRPLVAGNWKMNGLLASRDEARLVAERIKDRPAACDVLICPPFTLIAPLAKTLDGSEILRGGQDCHPASSGAHTGDVSAEMLKDLACSHVIVGHSERRADHGESDELVRDKAEAAISQGLTAIVCIGETENERDRGETLDVVRRQLAGSVPDAASPAHVTIAYEPVWAIGTGRTPTPGDVAEVHLLIRNELAARFGQDGNGMRILYGGSVKPTNAAELMSVANVDGALVGGASLKADDFDGIIEAYR